MTKVNLNKKLNSDNYLDHEETLGELLQHILWYSFDFDYKNVNYIIEDWDTGENGERIMAIQTNADGYSTTTPWSKAEFLYGVEPFAKLLETYRLHDGTLLYDALTKPGYHKYFGYNPNMKYD